MNVYEKISEVMKDVEYLKKDDAIEFGTTKYKAMSEEKVTSTIRVSLIKNGLVIVPIKQSHRREGTLSTVDVEYRIQSVENIEDYIIAVSSGTGVDTQDKGVGKAMTYAYKYLLLRTFAIPTGDDPDKISSAELDDKEKKALAKEPKPPTEKPPTDETFDEMLGDLKFISVEQANKMYQTANGNSDLIVEVFAKFGYTNSKEVPATKFNEIMKEIKARV